MSDETYRIELKFQAIVDKENLDALQKYPGDFKVYYAGHHLDYVVDYTCFKVYDGSVRIIDEEQENQEQFAKDQEYKDRVQQDISSFENYIIKDEKNGRKALITSILDQFENILDDHGIDIPDKDRKGDESEAHLYGTTYYELEGMINDLIMEHEKIAFKVFRKMYIDHLAQIKDKK